MRPDVRNEWRTTRPNTLRAMCWTNSGATSAFWSISVVFRLKSTGAERFLDQAVLQIARAVEIHHVKVLQYRPDTSDLLLIVGFGWKDGAVRTATLSADLRSPPWPRLPNGRACQHQRSRRSERICWFRVSWRSMALWLSATSRSSSAAPHGACWRWTVQSRKILPGYDRVSDRAAALIGAVLRRGAQPDEHASLMAAVPKLERGRSSSRDATSGQEQFSTRPVLDFHPEAPLS